jgi:elongation factor Ts
MAQITAELIKQLRERTGVGMGKCKEALETAHGDIELAIDNLRKAGIATAVKKEGRTANEGMIGVAESNQRIAFVEVNSETDFVAKNELFGRFVKQIAEEVASTNPASVEQFLTQKFSKDPSLTVDQYRATIVQAIGENIQIRRLITVAKGSDKSVGTYSHMGGKIATGVEVSGSNAESALAKDIAMHIAAAAPDFLSPEKIPSNLVEHEREIAKSQVQGKPAHIIDKIVEGKLSAYYDGVCLLRQKFVKDDSMTISDVVSKRSKETGKPLTVTNFIRWSVGQN